MKIRAVKAAAKLLRAAYELHELASQRGEDGNMLDATASANASGAMICANEALRSFGFGYSEQVNRLWDYETGKVLTWKQAAERC